MTVIESERINKYVNISKKSIKNREKYMVRYLEQKHINGYFIKVDKDYNKV